VKQGFSAGCSLEVTLKFADFENVKPGFWAGITQEWEADEKVMSIGDIAEMISTAQDVCRKVCEDKVDKDIYDVKDVKLFARILEEKKKGGK